MAEHRALIVSVVSGKGGVGKTMLSVSIARELSANTRTLLLDLDFFNRGLTGLMRHGQTLQAIPLPAFLTHASAAEVARTWELVEVALNLFHVRYPDLTPEEIRSLENSDVAQLARGLKQFLDEIVTCSRCESVIIDCHGGPDQLSFAACLVADYSLLVSEPDKITFYGTLHFLRQLRRVLSENAEAPPPDVRLVFNKVVPAFSARYLRKFYDKEIARLFDHRPLLAIFPIEMYLTKEFERTPFLTAVYPFSLLAKKTRVLLRDLLQEAHPHFVPRSVRHVLRPRLSLTRNSVARTPWFADLNQVMAVIAVGGVLIFAADSYGRSLSRTYSNFTQVATVQTLEVIQYAQKRPDALPADCSNQKSWKDKLDCWRKHRHQDRPGGPYIYDYYGDPEIRRISTESLDLSSRRALLLQDAPLRSNPDKLIQDSYEALEKQVAPGRIGAAVLRLFSVIVEPIEEPLALTAAIWFLIVLLFSWSGEVDRTFTYSVRARRRALTLLMLLVAAALWFLPLLLLTAGLTEATRTVSTQTLRNTIAHGTILGLALGSFAVVLGAAGEQWFKARQNFQFERQYFEGTMRVLFGCYILATPLLFWKAAW
jgi:cellulose biosynthesis protein BcsQ